MSPKRKCHSTYWVDPCIDICAFNTYICIFILKYTVYGI